MFFGEVASEMIHRFEFKDFGDWHAGCFVERQNKSYDDVAPPVVEKSAVDFRVVFGQPHELGIAVLFHESHTTYEV